MSTEEAAATQASAHAHADAQCVFAYHERTKHRLDGYARGPQTLNWSAQPDPFRTFAVAGGTQPVLLPLSAQELNVEFDALYVPNAIEPRPLTLASLGALLELSFAISAWKQYGPERWALRCNPSSGNLHPTEACLVAVNVPGLASGVYHYISRDHALERRAAIEGAAAGTMVMVGLSSIHWREAWKYGERAFRYCQHDAGHALGALRYAAAALGWHMRVIDECSSDEIARLLGLDRPEDFAGAEAEEPEVLVALETTASPPQQMHLPPTPRDWTGHANVLDPHPTYRWSVIDEVAQATRKPAGTTALHTPALPRVPLLPLRRMTATQVIRERRSAQHFDPQYVQDAAGFWRMLAALVPVSAPPWELWNYEPRVHPVIFVHRVEDVETGVYALPRSAEGEALLRAQLRHPEFHWRRPAGAPADLPVWQLIAATTAHATRTASCHQPIAAHCTFTVAMLAEFGALIEREPWRYRQLHWEAGLIGQVLYLEAEAAGIAGTGVGCYFDDVVHELLGIEGNALQSLYHFTVGRPLIDTRISTLPAYPPERYSTPSATLSE